MVESDSGHEPNPALEFSALPEEKKEAIDRVANEVVIALTKLVNMRVVKSLVKPIAKAAVKMLEDSLRENNLNENYIGLVSHRVWERIEEVFK